MDFRKLFELVLFGALHLLYDDVEGEAVSRGGFALRFIASSEFFFLMNCYFYIFISIKRTRDLRITCDDGFSRYLDVLRYFCIIIFFNRPKNFYSIPKQRVLNTNENSLSFKKRKNNYREELFDFAVDRGKTSKFIFEINPFPKERHAGEPLPRIPTLLPHSVIRFTY